MAGLSVVLRPFALLWTLLNHLMTALSALSADRSTCERGIGGPEELPKRGVGCGEGNKSCERGFGGGEEEPSIGAG